jgi:hypothetical protein
LHATRIDMCDRGKVDYQLCLRPRHFVDESLLHRRRGVTDQIANKVYDGIPCGQSLHVDDDRLASFSIAVLAHVTSRGRNRDLVKPIGGGA